MTGIEQYETKYKNKINNIIKNDANFESFYYFLKNSKINELSSQYNYLLHVQRFLKWSGKKSEELTLNDYTLYLGKQEDKSSSYKITTYSALKKYSKFLMANEINIKNPMQYIDRPKFVETEKTKQKRSNGYLTKKEIKLYKEAIETGVGSLEAKHKQEKWKDRDKAIIDLFLSTGIRLSALYKLDTQDIDFEEKKITVKEKGSKYKNIMLSDKMLNELGRWIVKRKVIMGDDNNNALFVSNRKNRLSPQAISNIVSKYSTVIENKTISAHKLRHTFGTQLYNKTKDICLTQHALGHNNIHTTELYINGQNTKEEYIANIMSEII